MGCKCNCSCGSGNGEQGPQGIQGAPGIQGIDGIQGTQGIQGVQGDVGPEGPQGPAGNAGLQNEYFASTTLDYGWQTSLNTISTVTYTIVSDGDYQFHANILTRYAITTPNVNVSIGVYVNGSPVVVKFPLSSVELFSAPRVVTREISFLWRGALLVGDVIDIRAITFTGVGATTLHHDILINKESI